MPSAWLRIVLHLRNIGLPRRACHRIVDFATNPLTRKCIDYQWFTPTCFLTWQIGRKLVRNFLYQPFIRPFKYLRRKPRYEELHPEDEVTLPRNNMAAGGVKPPRRRRRITSPQPLARWTAPEVNLHALRVRGKAPKLDLAPSADGAAARHTLPVLSAD